LRRLRQPAPASGIMGNACTKKAPEESPPATVGGSTPAGGSSGEADGDKKKTFRERRLSVSQMASQEEANRRRRLSVYGGDSNAELVPSTVVPPMASCGCKTVAGLEPVPGGSAHKINQDRGLALWPFKEKEVDGLFGVYDGHGRIGQEVSEYVIQTLPHVVADMMDGEEDVGEVLRQAYVSVDQTLADNVDAGVSGTTAVTCFVRNNHIWIANAGDSRAVICRKKPKGGFTAVDLSVDQKPDTPAEMRRILQMGGHVTPAGANGSPSRVWHNLRGLAMARSIGDHHAATVGVIAEPEITEYDVGEDDFGLIIASDGVWELLTSEQVTDIVYGVVSKEGPDPKLICDAIVEQSSYMWKVEEGDYRDDITVVFLKFPWLEGN